MGTQLGHGGHGDHKVDGRGERGRADAEHGRGEARNDNQGPGPLVITIEGLAMLDPKLVTWTIAIWSCLTFVVCVDYRHRAARAPNALG